MPERNQFKTENYRIGVEINRGWAPKIREYSTWGDENSREKESALFETMLEAREMALEKAHKVYSSLSKLDTPGSVANAIRYFEVQENWEINLGPIC